MPRILYCWRCRKDIPMLTEAEWASVSPLLDDAIDRIKRYREEKQCGLPEAIAQGFGQPALLEYERITGVKATDMNTLRHHRLQIYGPPCHACAKPLRTPQARYCAMCSAERPVASAIEVEGREVSSGGEDGAPA